MFPVSMSVIPIVTPTRYQRGGREVGGEATRQEFGRRASARVQRSSCRLFALTIGLAWSELSETLLPDEERKRERERGRSRDTFSSRITVREREREIPENRSIRDNPPRGGRRGLLSGGRQVLSAPESRSNCRCKGAFARSAGRRCEYTARVTARVFARGNGTEAALGRARETERASEHSRHLLALVCHRPRVIS